jgi:hypothetical protein
MTKVVLALFTCAGGYMKEKGKGEVGEESHNGFEKQSRFIGL